MNKTYLLNEICNIITSPVDKKSHDNEIHVKLCNYKDVYYNDFISDNINFMLATAKQSEIDRYKLYKNDVIITKDSESYDDIGISTYVIEDIPLLLCGYHLTILRPKSDYVDGLFLAYYLKLKSVLNCFSKYANGIIRYSLTQETYNKITIILPPLEEQKKIADILLTWDKAITTLKEIIQQKELQKKGLMQNLLTGKKRLNGFNDEWKEVKLKNILIERKEYAIKNNDFTHVSLTKEGIYEKTEKYNRDYLVKKKDKEYKITKLNDICYNPANLKFGVICKNNYGIGIFSPIYIAFIVKKEYACDFIAFCVTQPSFISKIRKYEEGTVYERKAVKPKDFLLGNIIIPTSIEEQKAIAEILMKADEEIELLNKQLELYTEQKKGLMQKLLTGKIRVN